MPSSSRWSALSHASRPSTSSPAVSVCHCVPFPTPRPGLPSRERPQAAVQEQAFPPTIPNPPDGGREAEELYGKQPKPYIVRGLSLVPDELRMHVEQEQVQYLPMGKILQPHYQHHDGLSRAQAEIVAGRVSALNEASSEPPAMPGSSVRVDVIRI